MEIKQHISLKPFNTFGIEVKATQLVEVMQVSQLKEVLKQNQLPLLILGGGSNVLFTQDFNGLVLKNMLKGIQLVDENENEVTLKVAAGEVWHEFVLYCIEKGYAGIENLSLIPGTVGASPIQNIGAYGVEVKNVIIEVEALNLIDYTIQSFSNVECEFDYRNSIFKTSQKGNYFITAVTFTLSKNAQLNTSYGAIGEELKKMNVHHATIKDISNAVVNIRTSKLPDPKIIGNGGSFFKNPTVSENFKNKILEKYPDVPNYPQAHGEFKIASGWLIEKCGWKGKRIDNYGVHVNQALVLVNYGGATGRDIFNLSEDIIRSVFNTFGIKLEREVNII